ncbi:aminotransferase class I/II-fold pyridoxal phosphate-dependent enzyme [Anaerotignum propionicum]|uniref:Aminotransferase n=1 Tax=Anaerotignum propionicum DSM 1682 TaxID=991789 RepID=A0A0X8VBM2_ANAPI|nr:aminotransferase class I/II-fold pyridoxal phosphate-dependent enzyme [Anaerotignum propionicum]AMJ40109.1 putative N-acetyl-LL-diaminopimelate aminotransferase [Anaerotignum propionicum DSM 1682]SHE80938.1 aminotransferase [[Clostridium] propionicum DSM 1682] [Anaerotignum propionicum DSM 1682]
MRDFVAKNVADLPPSGIRKFFDVVATMSGVVSLGVGEPDFKTPERVRQAAIDLLEEGRTRYTANLGMPALRERIAHYLERRFHTVYNPLDQIMCTIGASEAIDVALRTILEPGDEVLVIEPCYVSYKPSILLQHGVPVVVTTKVENDFKLMPTELERAITPKTKAIILPYPNNPTGAIMEKEDLEKIAPIIVKHDLLVISDEIYAELTYGGKDHVSVASIEGMYERTIVLNGFSKSFAMTGWRLGYAAGPKDLIKQMNKIHAYVVMSAPVMSQQAAIEALRDDALCDEDIRMMREAYDERRKYLIGEFNRLGLTCFEPKGAFYVFPSIQKTGLGSEEFCEKLLFEGGVAVVPGNAFGDCGEGFIRISYAYSMEELKICIQKIEGFLVKK